MSTNWDAAKALEAFGLSSTEVNSGVFDGESWKANGPIHEALNPSTGEVLAKVQWGTKEDYERCAANAVAAQKEWQLLPAPQRGEIVRQIGNALIEKRDAMGALLSLEMGKIHAEGKGEVQEFIDICFIACGLSRSIPGQIVPSERTEHALMEIWKPLGTLGIITAFNFPHAVWGWNSAVSLMCGNTQIVKGAESASLVTIATQKVVSDVLAANGVNGGVATLCQGEGAIVGDAMCRDKRVDLLSFTGSTKTGKMAQQLVHERSGQTIMELGGNNAILVMPSADIELALRSSVFAAAGTCGQRCTSLRRLLVHEDIYDELKPRLVDAYKKLRYGNPLDPKTLVGPIHNKAGIELFERTVADAKAQGGNLLVGGGRPDASELPSADLANGNFVQPTIFEIDPQAEIVQEERFVPVLYLCKVKSFEEAIDINNQVEQGLSASLFSTDMREVFHWLGPAGAKQGIVNSNTSCSGAECGLAFGGNGTTGWGRECGSDAWKQYMRRSSCAINFGKTLPLAQGIDFS
eukprot:CAMPEP_0171497554 /NCGR_PEP_ID=MMETSP0958-20121227/7340_1 /TAXON_ID=87120 /ORGANISM="Aurantiochytrium limacinum, Strain ATCCMYA-1381" /LENGTH=520 /DNA_ID=CAMNT_0012031817 /DNA_START=213 /DNA_END=1775 /DNA_ORIENTATION=+